VGSLRRESEGSNSFMAEQRNKASSDYVKGLETMKTNLQHILVKKKHIKIKDEGTKPSKKKLGVMHECEYQEQKRKLSVP